jgi:hypothetical protein
MLFPRETEFIKPGIVQLFDPSGFIRASMQINQFRFLPNKAASMINNWEHFAN